MREKSLSESSIKKYSSAIFGPLSQWARDAGAISGTLGGDTDSMSFPAVMEIIRSTAIFKERNGTGNGMYASALNHFYRFLTTRVGLASDLIDIALRVSPDVTLKSQLINARLGQGKFRSDLLSLWRQCSVSGYSEISILVASHIKPWSMSSDVERLDRYNGLLLIPNIDALFDKGLITFRNDGQVIVSSKLITPSILGIHDGMSVKFLPDHLPYIEFHRDVVFKG